jgi:hypothetical protein
LSPGEDPDSAEVFVLELHFMPFRSWGEFIPQRLVPEEKQRSSFLVFGRVVEVGAGHNLA